ncbi:alpha/beta hydrolase [Amycolatopsis magusensis]|uniref:Pimeloyl-ACP methyl ester carboxylesterase n=1 Tax=Amycolatopsis magusensis TaxID=882444 RepID=A0ABS4PQP0_9PSEU|nr:alpha/beta hydrolase [Amycolatopsis magusensis]MBP2181179.1 pimeloyl-ACP methyl ester carboxylesterase [Amycolatopsis magusensis]
MRKLLTVGMTVAVALGVVAGTAAPAGARQAGLSFGACPEDLAGTYPEMTCTTVQVPLDYTKPFGQQISLLVSKIPSKNPGKKRGSLFVNPGGPGGGAAEYVGRLSKADSTGTTRLPKDVLDAYDLIGMDPRGVEHSSPISCVEPDYFQAPQPDPDAPASRAEYWKVWGGYAEACGAKLKTVLPHLGTKNVARDMDRVRAGLGEDKLSFLGFSYGSYLGPVYGELFPGRTDRIVLDGLVNPEPEQMWYQAGFAQSPAVQQRVEDWLAWIAQYDSVFGLGSSVEQTRAAWNKTLADFRATPHGPVGAYELLGAVFGTMYAESGWEGLAHALSDYVNDGDDQGLLDWASPVPSEAGEQATAIFNAVTCLDAPWPADPAVWEADAAKVAPSSQFAWSNLWSSAACRTWPAPAEQRVKITGNGLPKALLFQTEKDPATPYAGALKMHQALPGSVLITERDSGKHCVFANPIAVTNPDAQRIGADYLVRGVLPGGDGTIPGHKLPVPTGTSALSTAPVAVVA